MNGEANIYAKLVSLPLFLGMNKDDLTRVVAHTKMGFTRYADGETIAKADDDCSALHVLIDGRIGVERVSVDGAYRVGEHIAAPYLVEPESLFGLSLRYKASYTAEGSANVLTLSKEEVLRLAEQFLIIRLNLLNHISAKAQKARRRIWLPSPTDVRGRIAAFIESHCVVPAGEKTLHIKMARLAEEINESRLDVSRALHKLQDEGLAELRRATIIIPALEKILNA